MIGFIFNIITGPQRLAMIVGGAMFVVASFWTWLKVHDHNVREEAIAEFNQAQQDLFNQRQAEYDKQLLALQQEAIRLREDLAKREKQVQDIVTDIERTIEAKGGNRPAPKYLREVVDKMQKNFGEKK
jgi:TRAP-type C4-dicarboxylate transport system substrate-binding protein